MGMRNTFKYRLYPTSAQETVMNTALDECRWLYNHFLEERKTTYEQTGASPSLYDQQAALPDFKQDRPSLATVHSQVLQNVAVDRGQTGTVLLKVRQCSLLVVQTGTSARLLIRCLSFFKKVVVQPAAFIKSSIHDCLLSRCRVQA